MRHRYVLTLTVLALLVLAQSVGAEVDREKLLKDTGVYATFAVFKVGDRWWAMDREARSGSVAEVKAVFQKHADKITVDTHLLRGLSEKSDFMIRIHSREMVYNQNFLLDFMSTTFGQTLHNTDTFNGITKALNYVPSFTEELKAELKTPPPQGSPYMIVVPIRKDAEWWKTGQDPRNALMKEHTEATVPYLKTVKRKLYHSSGLDDLDFITYFETAKLDDFNDLVIGLLKVRENHHNQRFGNPLLLGSIRPIDEILEILAR
ncbi:MAG: Chlorite dismutase [Candidatus Nitrospira kreftii]|uniref:Chlorite dismutase n=1 Tax=Candidatus Nitrospira kreftii TaxID=2652173 RepID=A0A7S8FF04_9BACT|nr:MAG: Chlorite dismutase [Candidatus Nitrospira kreftii]